MTQESFIICDNVVRIFKIAGHDVVALQGLDMAVAPAELLGVVGVSGSGKSTLMNILGGLDRPTAGRVWVDGKDLLKLSDTALTRYRLLSVGFLWQQSARNLLPYLNAQENIEYPMTVAGEFGRKKRQRAQKLLEIVGLSDRRKHRLSELSGGEQQRVAIAVALANNPKLLLADEPTGEVDTRTADAIYKIFRNLQSELKLTTIIVSHDAQIGKQVDRVIAIRDGKIASELVRQNGDSPLPAGAHDSAVASAPQEHIELTVVDSAGRLQIPKDLRQQFGIRHRVRLDATPEGVLIRPVETAHVETAEDMVDRMERNKQTGHWERIKRLFSHSDRRGGQK
jgi:ABC-type lipoprotein export system ATPase subunit/bifunctional DNA-binding transcriptional regulator/antitoxin component of YhaV-PrlF toxin-antitoxin module